MPSSAIHHHRQNPRPVVRLPPIRSISGVACHLPPLPTSRAPTTQVAHLPHTVKKPRRQVSVRACAACKLHHLACSHHRPCTRCATSGKECVDVPSRRGMKARLRYEASLRTLDVARHFPPPPPPPPGTDIVPPPLIPLGPNGPIYPSSRRSFDAAFKMYPTPENSDAASSPSPPSSMMSHPRRFNYSRNLHVITPYLSFASTTAVACTEATSRSPYDD